jgi:septal ring-binding cell division protein DamX
MTRVLLIAVLTVFSATTAFAADTFYVAKDAKKDNQCRVIKKEPDGERFVMVGTTSYATKAEAKAARKAAPECKPEA